MTTHITCQDVLDALYELIDCEECDRRSGLIDAGSVPGPDARARALMIKHVATCEHCSDALDAEPVPWWFGSMCAKMLQSRQQTQGE